MKCHCLVMCPCGRWFGRAPDLPPEAHMDECEYLTRAVAEDIPPELFLVEVIHLHLDERRVS